MRVEFLIENLESYLSLLTKVVPAHPQVPILGNLLLSADSKGFSISATDLEIGVRIKIPAKITEEGSVTIPGRQFAEVINSLPKDRVLLEEDKDSVVLTSRKNKFVFQTIPSEEFPNLFEEKGTELLTFTDKELKDIFPRLTFAASLDDARPEITGIYLSQQEDGVDCVATDGFRLSLKALIGKKILEEGEGLILSARLIQELLSLKAPETIHMYVHKDGNQVIFETEQVVMIGRLIEGTYPPYSRVIPGESKTMVTIDREEFHQMVKLTAVFARESANIVKLSMDDGTLSMTSKSSGIGAGDTKADIQQKGENNEVSFNVKFLLDLLRNVDSKELIMGVNNALDPVIFRSPEDPDFLHVIMPVRVTD